MPVHILEQDVIIPAAAAAGASVTVRLQLEVSLPEDCTCRPQPVTVGNPPGWKPGR